MADETGTTTNSTLVPNSDLKNVRISPERLIFDDPFEGKHFESKITLQNVGKTPVFVIILPPTSSNIKMKTKRERIFLPPGMKITRKITYTVIMATMVNSFIIPIHINNTFIPYPCEVRMTRTTFIIIPPVINFGQIDVGPITSKKKLQIINNGGKPSRYCIDLGLNELNIQIDPARGIVMEKSSVTLSIELNASREGSFQTEFWIIADNPICVKVFVNVIKGIIECIHEDAMKSFTFIKFPVIYYGTKSISTVLLKNSSQLPSLFCVTGEKNFKPMHLSDLRKIERDYNDFHISPFDGRLPSNDRRPFLLIFEPKYDRYNSRYRLILITIHRIRCNDIGIFNSSEEPLFRKVDQSDSRELFTGSVSSVVSEGFILSSDFLEDERDETSLFEPLDPQYNHIKMILMGEIEHPSLSILPDELYIKNLVVHETITRTLILTNNSKKLPIYYKYVKIAFIEVSPQIGILQTSESKEIIVTITPESCTDIDKFIKFELLYYDMPRVDNCTLKVVGSAQIPISFQAVFNKKPKKRDFVTANTFSFDKPNIKPNTEVLAFLKKESAILALPDDRPSSLKPWKNSRRCRTIYAAIPRPIEVADNDYMLTKSETEWKKVNNSYYQHYIQSLRSHSSKLPADSSLSLSIAQRLEAPCVDIKSKTKKEVIKAGFIPLTPLQLFNIEINPVDAFVDNVVARSSFSNQISITNKNDVAIRIYIRPQKLHSFYFPSGDRMVIGPKKTGTNKYLFFTESAGTRTHMVDIVVNENHILSASLTVKVSQAILDLSTTLIIYQPDDPPYKYLQISNTLNAPIEFIWDFIGDFTIDPLEGCVQPKQSLTCSIFYEAGRCGTNNYELQIRMNNKRLAMVRVKINKIQFDVNFTNIVEFTTVGKDVTTTISAKLENTLIDDVPIKFDTSTLNDGITINPKYGILPGNGFLMINFTLNSSIIGPFKCETVMTYARFQSKTITITGTIQYPNIDFSCDIIRFRKMSASSFDIKCFTVSNVSDVMAVLKFDVNRYPEIHFSEYTDSRFLEEDDIFSIPPRSNKVFSMHLYPFYPTVTSFYLPIKINGIDKTIDRSCPSIKVYISTLNHRILIDTWQYNFIYFPYSNYKSHTEEEIMMKVKDYTKLCIRFDELSPPFFFNHVRGGTMTNYPCSVVYELEAEEELVFLITFKPKVPGTYVMKLPVYIREDLSEDMHNYFYIKGEYPLTTIEFNCDPIHFGFVPCTYQVIKEVTVILKNHSPDCLVETFIVDFNVSIEIPKYTRSTNCMFQAKILFSSSEVHMVDTYIKFICSCGITEKLRCIGGADNCILTTYSFVMYYETVYELSWKHLVMNNITPVESKSSMGTSFMDITLTPLHVPPLLASFPYFPTEDNPFTEYMNKLVISIEKWLYEQIFHKRICYKIPDGICIFEEAIHHKPKNADPLAGWNIPFINILKYYCGSVINNFINTGYNQDIFLPSWIYGIYYNALDFLKQLGGMLTHVEPEYLLDYDSYKSYKTTSGITENMLSPSDFYLLGKQCWLDVILQTFKVLEYQRLASFESAKSSCNLRKSIICSILGGLENYRAQNQINCNIYSYECGILLAWLDKIFGDTKHKLVTEYSVNGSYESIKDMSVTNFGSDLTNCLAFCAVTIKYCSSLAQYLQGIYVPPMTRDECFHNACLLIKVWSMFDISFTIIPTDLIDSNPVMMQFFVAYLYEFLPHMMSTGTIHFSAVLGQRQSDKIVIGNPNDVTIKFNVKIFNDLDRAFSCDSTINIKAGGSKKLNISYHAKFIRKNTATLILNGELYSGKYFTNSKVYTLVGEPNISKPTFEYKYSSDVYKELSITTEIQTPFEGSTTYEIFLTSVEPTSYENLGIWPYSHYYKTRMLARVYINDYLFKSSPEGMITVTGSVCAITNTVIKYFCFFKSKIGDFYVSFISTAKDNVQNVLPLYVDLATGTMSRTCTCRHQEPDIENISCPRNVKISIPVINQSLWRAVISLYTKDADEREKQFWIKYQDSDIGPPLLKKILEHMKKDVTSNMSYIFKEKITYNISGDKNIFNYAPTIEINTAFASIDTIIHLNSEAEKVIMTMESDDGIEIRRYELIM